jgi:hypothetical protein
VLSSFHASLDEQLPFSLGCSKYSQMLIDGLIVGTFLWRETVVLIRRGCQVPVEIESFACKNLSAYPTAINSLL